MMISFSYHSVSAGFLACMLSFTPLLLSGQEDRLMQEQREEVALDLKKDQIKRDEARQVQEKIEETKSEQNRVEEQLIQKRFEDRKLEDRRLERKRQEARK